MSDAPDLLPCPFCGGEAAIENWPRHSSVICAGCEAEVASAKLSTAIVKWNRRVGGWTVMDMETVPKDRSILAFDRGEQIVVEWFAKGAVFSSHSGDCFLPKDLSHWRELPAPPEKE